MPRVTGDAADNLISGALTIQTRGELIPGPRVISAEFHADVGAAGTERRVKFTDVTTRLHDDGAVAEAEGEAVLIRIEVPGILTGITMPRGYLERFLEATHRPSEDEPTYTVGKTVTLAGAPPCPLCGITLVDAGTTSKGQVWEHPPEGPPCGARGVACSIEELNAQRPESLDDYPDDQPVPGEELEHEAEPDEIEAMEAAEAERPAKTPTTAELITWARSRLEDFGDGDESAVVEALERTLDVCERLLADVRNLSNSKADA